MVGKNAQKERPDDNEMGIFEKRVEIGADNESKEGFDNADAARELSKEPPKAKKSPEYDSVPEREMNPENRHKDAIKSFDYGFERVHRSAILFTGVLVAPEIIACPNLLGVRAKLPFSK